jgi:hypothetical protein
MVGVELIRNAMEYTLITKTGKVMQFYVESVANTYKNLYGGVVFTQQVLNDSLTFAVEPV